MVDRTGRGDPGLPVRVDPLTGKVNNPWGEPLGSIAKKGALFAASTLIPGLHLPGGQAAVDAQGFLDYPATFGAGAGAGMWDPYVWGSIIQALGGMGSAALAPQPQRRQGYTGDVSAQHSLEQSNDFLNTLRMTLEGLPPLDLSGASANLPDDPGGRVPTPQRRPMAMMSAAPGPATTGDRTQGALALLRSLGVAA